MEFFHNPIPRYLSTRGSWCCSVSKLCPTLWDPMNCSMPGLPVHHTPGVHSNSHPSSRLCHPAISSSVVPFSSCPQSFPESRSFPMSWLFTSGCQNFGASASLSNKYSGLISFRIDWFDLLVKGLLNTIRVFSSTTMWKHQFLVPKYVSLRCHTAI